MRKIISKTIKIISIAIIIFLPIFAIQPVFAQTPPVAPAPVDPAAPAINTSGKDALNFLDDIAGKSGLGNVKSGETATLNIIGNVINVALGFIGVVFFILVFWAGVRWMTSAGNEEVVKEAKNTIKTSVIGIAVVFLAFLFTNFVMNQVSNITQSSGSSSINSPSSALYCKYYDPFSETGQQTCSPVQSQQDCGAGGELVSKEECDAINNSSNNTSNNSNNNTSGPENLGTTSLGKCKYAISDFCEQFLSGTSGTRDAITEKQCSDISASS